MSIPEDKEELQPLLFDSHSRPAFLSKKQRLHVTTPLGRISPVVMEIRKVHPNGGTAAMGQIESRLRLLSRLDQHVSANSGPQVLVKTALDTGLELSGAAFGACLYPVVGVDGAHSQLVEVSGFVPSTDRVPAFQGTADQSGKEANEAPIPKLKAKVATGTDLPGFLTGLLPSSFTVRSSIVVPLLSLPLPSASAEPPGYLFYAHADPDVFPPETELLVSSVAAQLSIALRNAQLTDTLTREATVVARALAAQRLTDRRLAQALEAAQLGTWNWDAASGLIDFDERAAALFGVEPHRPLSRDALRERVVYADDLHHSPLDLHDFLRSKGQYSAEYRIDALDGVQRWIYANGRAVLSDATGEVAGLTGTVQDISERKKQESSLRTSEKLAAAGRLAASIAHEINNPLEAVTNLIYLAKTDPETPPGIARLLETADNELARVSQIAQQTLGFYRDTTHPVSIDLNHLL